MKRQHFVIPVSMLLAGVAWGDGYRSYNGSGPYGIYGNPYNANTPRLYGHQGYYPESSYNPHTPGVASPYGRYNNQYAPSNPYTPYNSPNPYKFNGNPYAADSIDTPYSGSPYQAENPYRTYGRPYHPNPTISPYFPNPINHAYDAHPSHQPNPYGVYGNPYLQSPAVYPSISDAQQLYYNHGYYQGPLGTPSSVPPMYEPYGNMYDSGNNQSNFFER